MRDQLIELAYDGALKITFCEKSLTKYWIQEKSNYPEFLNSPIDNLLPFPMAYNCEIGFSVMVGLTGAWKSLNGELDYLASNDLM